MHTYMDDTLDVVIKLMDTGSDFTTEDQEQT